MADDNVIDSSSRFGPKRTVLLLADAGAFPDDDARGAILIAKRINHFLYGDFGKEGLSDVLLGRIKSAQGQYREQVAETPYAELVSSGKLGEILDTYMEILIARSQEKLARLRSKDGQLKDEEKNPASLNQTIDQEKKKLHDLEGERRTYSGSPEYTQKLMQRVEALVKLDKYASLGKLVVKSGLIAGEPAFVEDFVSDVLGVSAARQVNTIAGRFEMLSSVEGQPDSEDALVRSQAMALAVRASTQSLASQHDFEPEGTELDRIAALKTLVSAQLHHAFSQAHLPTQWAELEKQAKVVADDYARTTTSLAYHYMATGAASGDARVKKMQANFKAEMDREGIELMSLEDAISRSGQLARASASDLLTVAGNDKAQQELLTKLANAAGAKLNLQALEPRRQLIAVELSATDPSVAVDSRFMDRLREQQAQATRGLSA